MDVRRISRFNYRFLIVDTFVRQEWLIESQGRENMSQLTLYAYGAARVFRAFALWGGALTILYGVIFIFYHYYGKKDKKRIYLSLLSFSVAIISMLCMVASPSFPARPFFCVTTFMILAIAIYICRY